MPGRIRNPPSPNSCTGTLTSIKDQSLRETAAGLSISEAAAQKRVNRGLGKLRSFFTKRGISSTTAIIAAIISANSIHAAPAALAQSVTAVAVAKGAAAPASTLALIKGTLKIMAWTKMKIAVVTGAAILLAAGGFTAIETEIHHQTTKAGQKVLDKIIAANRYWLLAPPDSVADYSYVYHLYWRWPGAPDEVIQTPIHVNAQHHASANERQGITYFSVLQQMARFPKQVRVENLRQEDEKIRLTLKFSQMPGVETSITAAGHTDFLPPLRINCGNGISNMWFGGFTEASSTADVVLDAQTMEPVSVVTQTENGAVEEFFSDYTEVTPGSNVPLAVTIKDTGDDTMVFDWHFKLHDNALWLLDESNYGGKRVLWIDQVAVNGAQK